MSNMKPESFIDKLGRLTASEAEIVAAEARREQERFITAEVVRIDNTHQEEAESNAVQVMRRETLSMAWAAAELLKNNNVPLEPWINKWPQYETKKGLFRTKDVFVRQLGSVAFETWRLHDMESSQYDPMPIEVIDSGFGTREARIKPDDRLIALALTSDGDIGFVRKTTTLSDIAKSRINRPFGHINQSQLLMNEINDLVDDQRYGVVTHDLVALNSDGDKSKDHEFAKLYADLDTQERQLKARVIAAKQLWDALDRKHDTRSFMKSMSEIYKTRTQPEEIDVDARIRKSIARLLATNNISLE